MTAPTTPYFVRLNDAKFASFGQSASFTVDDQPATPVWPVSVIMVESGAASDPTGFGSALAQIQTLIHIRAAELDTAAGGPLQITKGCQVTLADGRKFQAIDQPLRTDHRRLNWTCKMTELK
jgi:hypothetical protein